MKKIVVLGIAFLAAILITGNASAGNTIDTSNVNVMAYYNPGTEIDLSQAIQEFDFVTESTGQYVEGKLRIWYDDPQGRNPGNIQDFERRDGADTNILFATDVRVRVKSDGWIVAWLTSEQNLSDIVFWNGTNTGNLPSDTTLGQAIWRITDRVGTNYDQSQVNYYSYKYPLADKLIIGGRVARNSGETFSFLMPSATTVYEGFLLWSAYLQNNYGQVKLNTSYIYNKHSMIEHARYYYDVINLPRDTRHSIYIYASSYFNDNIIKSATAILYKTGL